MQQMGLSGLMFHAVLGAVLWGLGRSNHRGSQHRTDLRLPAPRWLSLVCGVPGTDGGISPCWAFMQIMGILVIVLGLFVMLVPTDELSRVTLLAVVASVVLAGSSALYFWQVRLGCRYSGSNAGDSASGGAAGERDRVP